MAVSYFKFMDDNPEGWGDDSDAEEDGGMPEDI